MRSTEPDKGYYNPQIGAHARKVVVGEQAVDRRDDVVLTTTLGSCVSACLFDLDQRIGGINHFLLPEARTEDPALATRYGAGAMERLINTIIRQGGRRGGLVAKLFGGAKVIESSIDVGAKNVAFAKDYLAREGIPIIGGDLGGDRGRRIIVYPTTGKVMRRLLEPAGLRETVTAEEAYARSHFKKQEDLAGDIELFD